jgi:glycosyltransferase involved in cell wall biosynthesis
VLNPRGPAGTSGGRTLAGLPRALSVAASVVAERLAENPTLLLTQVAAKLPHRVTQRAARASLAVLGRGAEPRAGRVVARWLSGDRTGALAEAESATAPGTSARTRRRVAAVALAVEQPLLAGRLLDSTASGGGLAARVAWSRGDVSSAIQAAAEGSDRDSRRTLRRLRGELDLLAGDWALRATARPRDGFGPARPDAVLHLVTNSLPHTKSGYAVRTQEIVRAQLAAGLDPLVVTRLGYPVNIGVLTGAGEDVVEGVRYRRLLPRRLHTGADARMDQQLDLLLAEIARFRPAVLHTTTHHVNGECALAAGRVAGIPVVYEVRGFLEETWLSKQPDRDAAAASERYTLWRDRETACMQGADLVVTLGEGMRSEIVSRGVPADKVMVIPNAVDEVFLTEPPGREETRAELGISDDEVLVGTVTSIVDYEGLDLLVTAVGQLRAQGLPVRLLVVGDGVARAALERQAAPLGDGAIFTGRVPHSEVRRYHAALDVFVVPRRDMRVCRLVTPLKPVEAMAGGRPVVASDLPALRELVTDGETGVLVRPDDPTALAEGLARLAGDRALRSSLGAAAREAVARSRTWGRNAERYREAYRALAEGGLGEHQRTEAGDR